MSRSALVLLLLFLPATASAAAPKAAEIDAAVRDVTGEAATAIDEAGAADARARVAEEARENQLRAARSRLEAARVRVNQAEIGLKAVDLDLKAADATGDLAAKERLAVERARREQRRRWRIEQRSEAHKEVVLAQRRLAEARTARGLAEARLTRAKLAAWVALGADAEVDKALASSSREVAAARRTLERDQRRTLRAQQNRDTATKAVESLTPESVEGRLVEAEERIERLTTELAAERSDLEAQRSAVERLGVRITEERDAAAEDRERLAELEDAASEANTSAGAAAEEAARSLAAKDEEILNLRKQLESKLGPRPEDDLAELQGELEAVRGERDRLSVLVATASEERADGNRKLAALEARADEAERALAAADELATETGRLAGEQQAGRVAELEAAVDTAEAERDALQQRLDEGGNAEEVKVRGLQVKMLRNRLEATGELHRRRIRRLEDELADRAEAVVGAEQRVARAQDEADRLAAELAGARADTAGAGSRAAARVAELEAARAAVDARLAELTDVAPGDRDGAMDALRGEADDLREQLLAAERATTAAQATAEERALRMSELTAELDRVRGRLAEATASATEAQSEARESEGAARRAHEAALATVQDRAEGAESRLVAAEAELQAGAARRVELQAEVESLKAALDQGGADARIAELEGRVEDLSAERADLTEQLSEARDFARLEMDVLRSQVEAFSDGLVEAEERVAVKDARVAELTEALDDAERARRDDTDALRAELRAVREAGSRRRVDLQDLEARLREAHRRLARLESENEGLWAKVDAEMDWEEATEEPIPAPK